jgi:hypothetical protein
MLFPNLLPLSPSMSFRIGVDAYTPPTVNSCNTFTSSLEFTPANDYKEITWEDMDWSPLPTAGDLEF